MTAMLQLMILVWDERVGSFGGVCTLNSTTTTKSNELTIFHECHSETKKASRETPLSGRRLSLADTIAEFYRLHGVRKWRKVPVKHESFWGCHSTEVLRAYPAVAVAVWASTHGVWWAKCFGQNKWREHAMLWSDCGHLVWEKASRTPIFGWNGSDIKLGMVGLFQLIM